MDRSTLRDPGGEINNSSVSILFFYYLNPQMFRFEFHHEFWGGLNERTPFAKLWAAFLIEILLCIAKPSPWHSSKDEKH